MVTVSLTSTSPGLILSDIMPLALWAANCEEYLRRGQASWGRSQKSTKIYLTANQMLALKSVKFSIHDWKIALSKACHWLLFWPSAVSPFWCKRSFHLLGINCLLLRPPVESYSTAGHPSWGHNGYSYVWGRGQEAMQLHGESDQGQEASHSSLLGPPPLVMLVGKESNVPATHPVFMEAHCPSHDTYSAWQRSNSRDGTTAGPVDVPAMESADSGQDKHWQDEDYSEYQQKLQSLSRGLHACGDCRSRNYQHTCCRNN